MNDGREYPYKSSQAIRRDIREQLAVMGWELSEAAVAKQAKGASSTMGEPEKYIDDDLFGFMIADKNTTKRTGPVRVSPLISLEPYRGDLDFATNYMGVKAEVILTSSKRRSTPEFTEERYLLNWTE